jgi:hypothetical protein
MARTGCALAFLLLALHPLPASAQWRVVVQEAGVLFHEAADDGSLVACTAGPQSQILQVIDPKAPAVLLTHPFPETVRAVAFAPDRKSLAVSTYSGVFRVWLADGRVEEVIPGAAGLVAFDAAGKRLGVLGSIPEPGTGPARRPSLRDTDALGVYDLEGKRWAHRVETPITTGVRVVFSGSTLLGYGKGGNPASMIPRLFYCDVQLDTVTGKARTRSSRTYRGRDLLLEEDWLPRGSTDKKPGGEAGKKDPDEGNPNYAAPKAVADVVLRQKALLKQADWQTLQKRLSSTPGHDLRDAHFAAVGLRDRILFGVQRIAGDCDPQVRTAVVELTRDGALRIHPSVAVAGELGRVGEVLAGMDQRGKGARVLDLTTGKTLLTLAEPRKRKTGEGPDRHFCREGLLVLRENRLALYRPGSAKPAWEQRLPKRFSRGFVLADEAPVLALACAGGEELAWFIRTSDGKLLGSAPRPADISPHLFVPLALDPAGKRLAACPVDHLQFYEVPSGRLVGKHPVKERSYFHFLKGLRSGWLLCGSYHTRLFDEQKGWGPEVPGFADVTGAQELDTPSGRRLLLHNSYGSGCLVDPATGKVLTQWIEASARGWHEQGGSEAAAGGRALVRPLAWRGAVEVVSLAEGKVTLTVHPVVVGKEVGWVAFTPDALWDASPGAERHVAVVGPRGLADARARDARRDPAAIRARLRSLWGPAGK